MVTIETENFEDFFAAPFQAYGPDSFYVSPMKSDLKRFLSKSENPLFKGESDLTYFTAYRHGKLLGRITAHFHAESNQKFGTNQAYFGYFDCADDEDVAQALLGAAEDWVRGHDFDSIAGNYNLTAMQQIGVMTSGFEHPPYTDLIYSPPHICQLLKKSGYKDEFPMTTFETRFDESYTPMVLKEKQHKILANPDFSFAPLNSKTLKDRIEDARIILNESFKNNPQFVPVTREEYEFQSKDMKSVIDYRISGIIHYKGKPAGCILCIPDLNPVIKKGGSIMGLRFIYHFLKHRLARNRAVLIYSGVIPELQGQGVNPLILYTVSKAMIEAGYEVLGNTWIGATNKASLRQKEKMGAHKLHELSLFRKAL